MISATFTTDPCVRPHAAPGSMPGNPDDGWDETVRLFREAVERQAIGILKSMLERHPGLLKVRDELGRTVLETAVAENHPALVAVFRDALMEHGEDGDSLERALKFSEAVQRRRILELFQPGPHNNAGDTMSGGSLSGILRHIVAQESKFRPVREPTWKDFTDRFLDACSRGDADLVESLVVDHPSLLAIRDTEGRTPHERSVVADQPASLKILLDYDHDPAVVEHLLGLATTGKHANALMILEERWTWSRGSLLQRRFLLTAAAGAMLGAFGLFEGLLDPFLRLLALRESFAGLEFLLPGLLSLLLLFSHSWDPKNVEMLGRRIFSGPWFVRVFLTILVGFEILYQIGYGGLSGSLTLLAVWFVGCLAVLVNLIFP